MGVQNADYCVIPHTPGIKMSLFLDRIGDAVFPSAREFYAQGAVGETPVGLIPEDILEVECYRDPGAGGGGDAGIEITPPAAAERFRAVVIQTRVVFRNE